jgi:phage repressor protein C with HTH and peptisase S24 domain
MFEFLRTPRKELLSSRKPTGNDGQVQSGFTSIQGRCMEPVFHEGDIIIETFQLNPANEGDVVILETKGKKHRMGVIGPTKNGVLNLLSLNSVEEHGIIEQVPLDQVAAIKSVGTSLKPEKYKSFLKLIGLE